MLICLAILDLCLIYPVFRISRGRYNSTTKVVRDQGEETAANARDDTITLPSSVVHCKETETEKFVRVTKDVRWVFILIPVVYLCMTFECIVLVMGVTVCQLTIMHIPISIQRYELTLNPRITLLKFKLSSLTNHLVWLCFFN